MVLTDHKDSPDHNKEEFDYRDEKGIFLHLEDSTRLSYHVQYINVQDTVIHQNFNKQEQLGE
jgi:hypothetical protein